MNSTTTHLVYRGSFEYPAYQTEFSAGFDLPSEVSFTLCPGDTFVVPTACFLAGIAKGGKYLQIAPRSGLALKGIDVLAGIVDEDYRQEIKVILINHSKEPIIISAGTRVAQGLWKPVEVLYGTREKQTVRSGGFGSTNISEL